MYGSLDMNLKMKMKLNVSNSKLLCDGTALVPGGASPECLQLIPLLQLPQLPSDFVQKVGSSEAAAVAVKADHDGAETADQNRGPVHLELLRHHLATRRAVPVKNPTGMRDDSLFAD